MTLALHSSDFASNSFLKEGGFLSLAVTCVYYSCMYLCSFQRTAAAAATSLSPAAADGDKARKRMPHVTLET
jgi:hypothetical protein